MYYKVEAVIQSLDGRLTPTTPALVVVLGRGVVAAWSLDDTDADPASCLHEDPRGV